MGMFDFLRPKGGKNPLLQDLIKHNADVIQKDEGKSRFEADYLAICLIIDDLSQRPNGRKGYQEMMAILQSEYPQHLNDVITYVGWSTGQLPLKPEYEEALKKRHAK